MGEKLGFALRHKKKKKQAEVTEREETKNEKNTL